jgi:protein ImuB
LQEAGVFAALYAARGSSCETLLDVARDFSPRIETCGACEVVLDLAGLTRLLGDAKTIAGELRRTAADRGLRVRIAIAGTRTAARLLARDRAGITIVEPGDEARALENLRLEWLEIFSKPEPNEPHEPHEPPDPGSRIPDPLTVTLRRWGLRTLGDFAALPADEVAARLGQTGAAWQRLARGEDAAPLVPSVAEERFEQALDLEWPIEGLEPLSFVLARLLEPLSAHLERRDRGAAALHIRLHLVKRNGVTREVHERTLQLPAPMRDARTLRTLALLDLESHPPSAAIDRVVVAVDPTPGRVIQFSLLTRPLPSPEQLSTLMARLTALMGEGRCGSTVTVDSWEPGAFEMASFAPRDSHDARSHAPHRLRDTEIKNPICASVPLWPVSANSAAPVPRLAIRRFRFPIPARVRVDRGVPVRVVSDRRGISGGKVDICAGPWRSSGGWWVAETRAPYSPHVPHPAQSPHVPHPAQSPHVPHSPHWDRDEWDVTLSDGATYRVFRERDTDAWFIEGVVD